MDCLSGDENVELVRIEDQFVAAHGVDRLPEVMQSCRPLRSTFDDCPCECLPAIADQAFGALAFEIDGEGNTGAGDIRLAGGTRPSLACRLFTSCSVRSALPMRKRICDRREPRRTTIGKVRGEISDRAAVIASRDLVEFLRAIGNHAGEDIEAACRAFRVGGGRHFGSQRQALHRGTI